jgi:hypothetical protein
MARPPAPEGTVVQGADGSYQVKRNGQWVASDASGQPTAAPLSGAPDTVGRRQEYTAGMKQIAADLARLRSTDNLDASLDQFDTANSQVSTGPGRAGGNLNPVNLLANMDQNYNDMQAAAGKLQVGSVPQGQGAVSDFERRLYAMGSPNLTNMGPTNRSIITNMRATRLDICFRHSWASRGWHRSRGWRTGHRNLHCYGHWSPCSASSVVVHVAVPVALVGMVCYSKVKVRARGITS